MALERCLGCGGRFASIAGTTHRYMLSSPACWAHYGQILAREYSDASLLETHRLSVDAYAAQHPGGDDRQSIQSVGLHLARLMLQLDSPLPPSGANDAMLKLADAKASLPFLDPPQCFLMTVADIQISAPAEVHVISVRAWASATWAAWSAHHECIRTWTEMVLVKR